MKHYVQFSTGAGSAEVAFRVYAEHGPEATVLITADTLVEDADNWRYAREVVALMPGVEWVVLADGRTPMQVGRDERVVPSDRMPCCSKLLKRVLIRRWLEQHAEPRSSLIYLGYDWTEEHRLAKAIEPWLPYEVRCPLMEPPYLTKHALLDAHRARGVEPPRLYAAGFSHANCGGGCVRGGHAQWARLLGWDRERYLEWEAEEEKTRQLLERDVSILTDRRGGGTRRPLPLRVFRERLEAGGQYDRDDEGACGCDPWA